MHALAKELEVKSREILEKVAEQIGELELKGHMSWIPAEHVLAVKAIFAPPEAPSDPEDRSADDLAPTTDEGSAADEGSSTDEDGEDRPKKKRRRRRRGGRKHRRRNEEDGDSSGDPTADRTDDDGHDGHDGHDEPSDSKAEDDAPPSRNESDPDDARVDPEPTTEPAAEKPRRSLYGGRFQRTNVPTPIEDR